MADIFSPVVLVVEDDAHMNYLECRLLAKHGFQSIAAFSGLEAIALFEEKNVDAVLLDIMMPGMDGFETCQILRRPSYRQVPIIMVTALDGEEPRRRSEQVGADGYFRKPFDPEKLMGTLRNLVSAGLPS